MVYSMIKWLIPLRWFVEFSVFFGLGSSLTRIVIKISLFQSVDKSNFFFLMYLIIVAL